MDTDATRISRRLPALIGLALAVPGLAGAEVGLPPLRAPLDRPLDRLERARDPLERLDERLERETEAREAETVPAEPEDAVGDAAGAVGDAAEPIGSAASSATSAATSGADAALAGAAGAVLRPFSTGTDPAGRPVEAGVVVGLLDERQAAAVVRAGFPLLARRDLPALGLSLVSWRKPDGAELAPVVEQIRRAAPGAAVDFNHLYRFAGPAGASPQTGSPKAGPEATPSAPVARGDREAAAAMRVRVGMIDSAVMAEHASLRGSVVVSAGFVGHEGTVPVGHGTAVASLIAASAGGAAGIWSASVFFQVPGYAPGATTESLVAALDWLAAQDVDVVNMSLAGPGNALLERALAALSADGPVVVAAVGNNGPAGEPLYPAAYDGVIGVTAVDRDERVFVYANRGDHVDYAALGVDLRVADAEGTWRVESGTSMASPHVAVVAARMLGSQGVRREELAAALTAVARDLGERGFDPVFGHGLLPEAPVRLSRE